MSTQEQTPSSGGTPPRAVGPLPPRSKKNPPCPTCGRRMTVKQVMPVLFASELDDVIYGCEDCGTEVKRTVKRA